MNSNIDASLIEAYRRTRYSVTENNREFILLLGIASPELQELYRSHNRISAAFITAWNPRSTPTPDAVNAKAQKALTEKLAGLGCITYTALGSDPLEECKAEPSFLAVGISEQDAISLAREFQQNAIVFASEDAIPRLVLTPDPLTEKSP